MKKVLFVITSLIIISGCTRIPVEPEVKGVETKIKIDDNRVYHRSYFMDKEFFDKSYDNQVEPFKEKVYGGIIPHHLLAKYLIADFFQALEKNNNLKTVILIGPNHREVGRRGILSSKATWKTPYGDLEPNLDVINLLESWDILDIDERVFVEEHSISGIVPFIKRSFPKIKFIPIVLKTVITEVEIEKLANTLSEVLPEDSLVLVSVDFAHEVSSDIADEQDAQNIDILKALNFNQVEEMFVDSKPSIKTLLHYLDFQQAKNSILLANSNTAKVTGDTSVAAVTSYITMYFTK